MNVLKAVALTFVLIAAAFAATWYLARIAVTFGPQEHALTVLDVYHIAELVVLTLGLGSVALLWRQSRENAQWNKLLSYHKFFSECPPKQTRLGMMYVLRKLNNLDALDGQGTPILDATVNSIEGDATLRHAIKHYLDHFEQLCGAINCGVVDMSYAYELEGTRVIKIARIFRPYVKHLQKANKRAYIETERLAAQWRAQRRREAHTDAWLATRWQQLGRKLFGVQRSAP
jgi:hypothetical protein